MSSLIHVAGHPSSRATVVGNVADLPIGSLKLVKIEGRRLCIVHTASGVHALDNACPHEGYGLTTGDLDGELLTCAWHNWKFKVDDGTCVLGDEGVRSHRVLVEGDEAFVVVEEPTPAEERGRLLPSLREAIDEHQTGRIAREVVRLLRADADPA